MTRFTEQFHFHIPPRCPICQTDLQQGCWTIRGGVAFCASCAEETYPGQPIAPSPASHNAVISFLSWFHTSRTHAHFTQLHGIRFYTPHPAATRRAAAHLDPWRGDPPAHRTLLDGYTRAPDPAPTSTLEA
jgi:hypothetical protein